MTSPDTTAPPMLSVVIPVKDEADTLAELFERLIPQIKAITERWELLFVNDGSCDRTLELLLERQAHERRIRILDLSRNFGKEAALSAGLHYARGGAVVTMDADLQHPPELIAEMIERWHEGAEMVIGTRLSRAADGFVKRIFASMFYLLFNLFGEIKIPPHAGDFRLFDRKVVEAFRMLGERNRFNKGIFAWLGFRQTFVGFDCPTGTRSASRWRPLRLLDYGVGGIFSFSATPIRLWSLAGLVLAGLSLLFGLLLVARTLVLGVDVPGYASLMVAVLFLGGVNMAGIGLVGEYVGRVFTETKARPLYVTSLSG